MCCHPTHLRMAGEKSHEEITISSRATRFIARVAAQCSRISNDHLVQFTSIVVIVIIMTGEALRLSFNASEQIGVTLQNARYRQSHTNKNSNARTYLFKEVARKNADDDIERVSYMLYKLITSNNIVTVVDSPCVSSLGWIPSLVHRLEFEIPRFRYYCVLKTRRNYRIAKRLAANISALHPVYHAPRNVDLAVLWNAFGYLDPHSAWRLLRSLNTKFVVVPHYPNVERNSGHVATHGRVNVRRSPYRFGEPLRIMKHVQRNGSEPKQMLFYRSSAIRSL